MKTGTIEQITTSSNVPRHRKPMSEQTFAYILLLPTIILIAALLLYPLLYSLYLCVFDLNLTKPWLGPKFVGFKNFSTVLRSTDFWRSLRVTAYFAFFNLTTGMIGGLALALLLNARFKFRGIIRGLMIIPWAVPGVVNGLLWQWIYNSNYGALNGLLIQFGIIKQGIAWLADPRLAMNMLILADIWTVIPFICLMYLAALQSIPEELYEAGIVDGTTKWQAFTSITVPILKSMTLVLLVLRTIAVFKVFDIIYTLTKGGPASSTSVVGYYVYEQGFRFTKFGVSAAASYILTFIILALVIVYFKVMKLEQEN